jgi:hypothetical protein
MALNPNPIDALTSKHLVAAVRFTWGDPVKTAAYVRWERDEQAGLYLSAPELDVKLERQDGGVAPAPGRVQLLIERQPLNTLCRPYAHAPVTVEIGEVDPLNWADTFRIDFVGKAARTYRNKWKNRRLVEVEVVGLKERLGYPVGLPVLSSCQHVLGDEGCQKDLGPHTFFVVCTGVVGRAVTFAGLPARPIPAYFQWGEMNFDGLSVLVGDDPGGNTLQSAYKNPPPEWVGQTLKVVAGCDKRIDGDCRTLYQNEHRFVGLGIKVPAYNPQYENP